MSAKGNYILGITETSINFDSFEVIAVFFYAFYKGAFQIQSENYETVQTAVSEIFKALSQFTQIEINGVQYEVEKYFGGDMKFLAIIYGINAANSHFPCLWCEEFNSQKKVDSNEHFKITR